MDVEESDHSSEEEYRREEDRREEDQREEGWGMCLPPRPDPFAPNKSRDFRKTTDECYRLIQEAMFSNQWERAASLLTCYVQTLESHSTDRLRRAAEIIWRIGNEILLNHPQSGPEEVSLFNGTMKNIGVKNYLPISLEQVYWLLCDGQTEEASVTLSIAGSWRFGRISISQDRLRKLIQAYKAVLDYHSWMDKRSALAAAETDYSSQSQAIQDMSSLFRQASIAFQEILQYPGVWDPFILCYVDLLEASENQQEAEKVLTEYAYNKKNPANPNAHVYLYEFLKRNGASDEMLINVLQVLHGLVPSHKLMLKLSKLLGKSESEEHRKLALQVAFDLLDFSGCKDSKKAWSCLVEQMKKCLKCDRSSWITEMWTSRSDWWPSYHFAKFNVTKDWENNVKLAINKASVAVVLQGQAGRYFSAVNRLVNRKQKKVLNCVKKLALKHQTS